MPALPLYHDAPGVYSNEGHSPDGPLADQARSALEGHTGTMTGRFQGQEENAQAIPREITPEVAISLIEAAQTIQARITPPLARRAHVPLRGQTEHMIMIDDAWPEDPVINDEEKAQMCLIIADHIFRDLNPLLDIIQETAVDLMSTPTMNIERIFKRIRPQKSTSKPLSRFQILKREE